MFSQMFNLFMLSIVEVFGDFSLEKFANTGALQFLGLGIGWYGGVIYFLVKSLVGSNILYVNGMWDGVSTLVESLAAIIFLGERLINPVEYLGLGMIIGGIMLLRHKKTA